MTLNSLNWSLLSRRSTSTRRPARTLFQREGERELLSSLPRFPTLDWPRIDPSAGPPRLIFQGHEFSHRALSTALGRGTRASISRWRRQARGGVSLEQNPVYTRCLIKIHLEPELLNFYITVFEKYFKRWCS